MKYPIYGIKDEVLFEAEIECDEFAADEHKKRLAVLWAVKKGRSLLNANLRNADLEDTNLSNCDVKIENIHQKVYEAASQPDALDMKLWHRCDTTHCRAGWVVHLAGKAGYELEKVYGTAVAALMIYQTSDPDYHEFPNFYTSHEKALADMKRLAEAEAA